MALQVVSKMLASVTRLLGTALALVPCAACTSDVLGGNLRSLVSKFDFEVRAAAAIGGISPGGVPISGYTTEA